MAQQQAKVGDNKITRLPLLGAYSNRGSSANKDQRFVNIFPETRKVEQIENTKIFLNKRPGLKLYKDFGTGTGRGFAQFNNKLYVAIGNTVWEDGVTPTAKITLTGTTGHVGMLLANSSVVGDYLFVADGTKAWIIDTSGVVTEITDSSLHSITITDGGTGYGSVPTVTITGGTGATGTATVSDGIVTGISITLPGTGFTTPVITIDTPVKTFDATTLVNTTNDTITLTGHTYGTGNAVTYSKGSGGTVIGGLTDLNIYYIINIDANTVKLATSGANASAGTAINLTSVGAGTVHTLTGTQATASGIVNALPTPHVPVPTFIDGYIVLARANSVDVYTCDLDQPTKWSTESYLSAEMFPDPVISLTRQNNQIVVMGHNSIEFFYDAANASGSPLSRNDSTTIQMGTIAPYCIYQNEQFCAYISHSDSGGRAVWLIQGFQPKKISDEYIERILDAEGDMTPCRGFGFRSKGHMFYMINLKTQGRTLVYDIDEKLWHEWSSNTSGNHGVFSCDYMADMSTGVAYVLHNSNGCIYSLDPDTYQDDGTSILTELVTNRYDMDTYRRKFMTSMRPVGDRYETGNSVDMSWSDDDYQTWSNTKTISLTDDYPVFSRLGSFRRRAFRIKNSLNYPLRLEALEVEYKEGNS